MTTNESCATETGENDGIPSKRYQFRLKIPQALEVDRTIDKEFSGNVTQFFKSLLRDRAILAKHRRERAEEVVALIQRYGLSPRDLTDAGLAWSDWTDVKRGGLILLSSGVEELAGAVATLALLNWLFKQPEEPVKRKSVKRGVRCLKRSRAG